MSTTKKDVEEFEQRIEASVNDILDHVNDVDFVEKHSKPFLVHWNGAILEIDFNADTYMEMIEFLRKLKDIIG